MAHKFQYSISDTGAATAAAGAATLNRSLNVITSEALTTAAGANYTLTLTNNRIAADSYVSGSVKLGTATQGLPVIATITPAAGSVVVVVQNADGADALDGTIVLTLEVMNGTTVSS